MVMVVFLVLVRTGDCVGGKGVRGKEMLCEIE